MAGPKNQRSSVIDPSLEAQGTGYKNHHMSCSEVECKWDMETNGIVDSQ